MSVLLIDTNVWSYLSEETDPRPSLRSSTRRPRGCLLNSMMLTEALRSDEATKRTDIVNMMASRYWRKLPAHSEAMES